jgi:adenine deaminase
MVGAAATIGFPIAGLMNDKPLEEMSDIVEKLGWTWQKTGCSMVSPFMTMALIPLACPPELRLMDRGLVDCTVFRFAPLFVENETR